MARYRITKPAYLAANGDARLQYFRAGSVIEVADDILPAAGWIALDDAAKTAFARRTHDILPSGVQARHRKTGQLSGGAGRVRRSPDPSEAPFQPKMRTTADWAKERAKIYTGKEREEIHGRDVGRRR